MTRADLKVKLVEQAERWGAHPYGELRIRAYPVIERFGTPGTSDFFQVEVTLLEHTDAYVHVSVAVDDGGLTAFVPVSTSVVVHARAGADSAG